MEIRLVKLTTSYLYFLSFVVLVGCKDVNDKLIDNLEKEIDESLNKIDRNRKIIESQKKSMKELKESWRMSDSIDSVLYEKK